MKSHASRKSPEGTHKIYFFEFFIHFLRIYLNLCTFIDSQGNRENLESSTHINIGTFTRTQKDRLEMRLTPP